MCPRRAATIAKIAAFALPALVSCKANPNADQTSEDRAESAQPRVDPLDPSRDDTASEAAIDPVPALREFPLPAGPGSYAPAAVSAGDLLYLAWYERTANGDTALRFAKHDGQAWGPTETLVSSATIGFDARIAPSLGTIGELTVYVGWPERAPSGLTSFRLSRSRGAGKRWEAPLRVFETHDFAPVSPAIVPDGARTATLTWLHDAEHGARLHQTTLPENGPLDGLAKAAAPVDELTCACCPIAASGSSAGQLLLSRSADARRLSLHTKAGHHLVAATEPEIACTERFVGLAAAGSTLAVAWSDAGPEIPACVAFSNSPKSWPPCARLGRTGQRPAGDLVLLDEAAALVTFAADAGQAGSTAITARAIRRDGVLGTERSIATVPPCPAEACGRMRTVAFGDRVVWFWVDPGVEGQSRIRAAIADAAATH